MYIKTKRLVIRDFEFQDWHAVFKYISDKNTVKYIPEGVFSENDSKEFVSTNINEDAEKFPVVLIEENAVIGHLAFHRWFSEQTYEIGWVFNKKSLATDMRQKRQKR